MLLECYDNEGKTFDRFTIVIDTSVYTMSHNALSPQGVNMYCCEVAKVIITDNDKKIEFTDLPAEVQQAVIRRKEANSAHNNV